ncbi:hypothetical protein GJV26_26250 [Massilia dura]|uniref:Uncharacterized protein n=1 Tax=Pseudoduganella dura TaxID=321982 RepID=A0A6I3XW15_9BURK|nr:hypothetical protein [Pseudoduganella dura]MUI15935.1 hypothetical protein [Pseudoduganella dura]
MNTTQQSPKPDGTGRPAVAPAADTASDVLDEALDESFPASDPVAVSITSVDPGRAAPPAPPGKHGTGQGK